MKTRIWLVAIVAVVLFGLVGWTGFGQRTQRAAQAAWEYRVVRVWDPRPLPEAVLNDMGAQGWELIIFQPINKEGTTSGAGSYLFKRARTN